MNPRPEESLNEVVVKYFDALAADRHVDRAQYPDLAEFFDDADAIRLLTGPLRAMARRAKICSAMSTIGSDDSKSPPQITSFGDYDILEVLGQGGMGIVYKARHRVLKHTVAIKMILAGAQASAEMRMRFLAEAKAVAGLQHPHIVQIHDFGECDGVPYFTLNYFEGASLADYIRKSHDDPIRAARIIATVARAVDHAHSRGILHRDLKPANILLDRNGEPHVTDFGLAKFMDEDRGMTMSGAIVGTASYMPPEQAARRRVTLGYQVDVYALGATLYELLTGRPPFKGETYLDTIAQVIHDEPVPPSTLNANVKHDLDAICLMCLEKDPALRYATARELAEDLERSLQHEPVRARRPSFAEIAWRNFLHQQFANVSAWGWIILLSAGINGSGHLTQAWAIADDQPRWILLTLSIGHMLVNFFVFFMALRNKPLTVWDRHGIVFTVAGYASSYLLIVLYRPSEGMDLMTYRQSLFPLLALLHAALFFVQGSIFWAGLYAYGIGYALCAIVMKIFPEWAGILFALYYVATQLPLGMYLLRLGRSPEFAK